MRPSERDISIDTSPYMQIDDDGTLPVRMPRLSRHSPLAKSTGAAAVWTEPVPRVSPRPWGAWVLAFASIAFAAGAWWWALHK